VIYGDVAVLVICSLQTCSDVVSPWVTVSSVRRTRSFGNGLPLDDDPFVIYPTDCISSPQRAPADCPRSVSIDTEFIGTRHLGRAMTRGAFGRAPARGRRSASPAVFDYDDVVTFDSQVAVVFPSGEGSDELANLYRALLGAWNSYDESDFAAAFAPNGTMIGFDGSTVTGREEIRSHLSSIFSDHQPARYVGKVQEIKRFPPDVAFLRAHVGMVPPAASELEPATNAIQTLLAVKGGGELQIQLFQNTPAAFHGRRDAARRFTADLAEVLEHYRSQTAR
jgi:uncharacterized protein (TIGR02246 family)